MTSRLAVVAVIGLTVGCGDARPTAPTSTASTVPQTREASPPNPVVAGVVFENTAQGRRPIAGARVWVVDLIEGPYGVWPWYEARADASGRYVSSFFEGREIKVTAMAPGDDGMLRAQSFAQVCARHAIVHGDTTVDVELSPIGLQPSDWRSPVLSGTVFEDTPQGRRALANMGVLYTSYGVDGADVYTRTDAAGRYTFCGLPLGPGSLVAGCNVITSPPTPRPTIIRTEIRGDTVVNIDCP